MDDETRNTIFGLLIGLALIVVLLLILVFFIRFLENRGDDSGDTPSPPSGGGGNGGDTTQKSRLRVTNNCSHDIWVQQINLPGDENVFVPAGKFHDYDVPNYFTPSVRLWPKIDCDENGDDCRIGQSQPPCPPEGCSPPFDSKAEFTFGDVLDPNGTTTYDISFVDGYTLPISIIAKGDDVGNGSCQSLECSGLTLDKCPSDDSLAGTPADLRVKDASGKTVACIAPCQYAVQPSPYGIGVDVSTEPALHMCCPTPCEYLDCQQGDGCDCASTDCSGCVPGEDCTWENKCATTDSCSSNSDPNGIKNTKYYSTIKKYCPNSYGYAYDDNPQNTNVTMTCPAENMYEVVFCPVE